MSRPLLVAPELDRELRVEADTSNFAMGGVLSIKCKNSKWRPVAYISKLLMKPKGITKYMIKRY